MEGRRGLHAVEIKAHKSRLPAAREHADRAARRDVSSSATVFIWLSSGALRLHPQDEGRSFGPELSGAGLAGALPEARVPGFHKSERRLRDGRRVCGFGHRARWL